MSAETLAALLTAVKTYLQITWTDDDTNNRLTLMIQAGVAYLDSKLGTAGEYTEPGHPRTLLLEYVRYARDGALDVFENNYLSMILAMQHERMVEIYADNQENTLQTQAED